MPSKRFKSCAGRIYNLIMQANSSIAHANAAIIIGLTINTITNMPIMTNKICIASIIMRGSTSSMAPISLEKRFKIRPDGFKSKKRIGACRMLANIRSCNTFDDRMQTLKKR